MGSHLHLISLHRQASALPLVPLGKPTVSIKTHKIQDAWGLVYLGPSSVSTQKGQVQWSWSQKLCTGWGSPDPPKMLTWSRMVTHTHQVHGHTQQQYTGEGFLWEFAHRSPLILPINAHNAGLPWPPPLAEGGHLRAVGGAS